MTTQITLITRCKILQPTEDLDSIEQIRERNRNGCQNVHFFETYDIEIVTTALVNIQTLEVEECFYEDRIDYESVFQLASAAMRSVRRKKKSGAKISQIEFSIIAAKELMTFHTAEIENRLATIIKK